MYIYIHYFLFIKLMTNKNIKFIKLIINMKNDLQIIKNNLFGKYTCIICLHYFFFLTLFEYA